MIKPYNRPVGEGNAPLLVAGATTFPPAGDFILRYALSEGIALRSFIVPPHSGGKVVP